MRYHCNLYTCIRNESRRNSVANHPAAPQFPVQFVCEQHVGELRIPIAHHACLPAGRGKEGKGESQAYLCVIWDTAESMCSLTSTQRPCLRYILRCINLCASISAYVHVNFFSWKQNYHLVCRRQNSMTYWDLPNKNKMENGSYIYIYIHTHTYMCVSICIIYNNIHTYTEH